MKGFIRLILTGPYSLITIGIMWFISGYLIYNYIVPWPFLAFGAFPIIYFGVLPSIREVAAGLSALAVLGGLWYGSVYLLRDILLFPSILAYAFLPIVFIMFTVFYDYIFPGGSKEKVDGTKEDKTG